MPRAVACFLGGPCDGNCIYLNYTDKPPATVACKGTTYHYMPNARGALAYGTQAYIDGYNNTGAVRGSRDVFRAWTRLHHVMGHRTRGERNRIVGARHRIRRAVK